MAPFTLAARWVLLLWGLTAAAAFNWHDTDAVVAFGDSYTYVQGTGGLQNYSFLGAGVAGEYAFTPAELLDSAIVQNFTATAEGGPNWVEFLTGCGLANGTTTRPATCDVELWDFAFGGADVSDRFTEPHHDFTISLVNQTHRYLTWAEPVLAKRLDKNRTLVAVWIGINDVGDTVDDASLLKDLSLEDLWSDIISTVFAQTVQPMYDAGYHQFLLVNLPPLDRTPGNQAQAVPSPDKDQVDYWNQELASQTQAFAKKNPSATMLFWDVNTFLNGVMDNPAKYGIRNTTSYCPAYDQADVLTDPDKYGCRPLDQYFWYNTGHLTSHVHKIMTPDLVSYLEKQSSN